MAFIKKKRYKFNVDFTLEELDSVPFVSGVMFSKVRLLDGGSFTELSSREEITDHCVRWNAKFSFSCKTTANQNTGVLETCLCRVSVRRELKGGRTYQKLGFADINLAEFAGSGLTTRRYLLEGYDSKHRQDNSMLRVTIDMALSSGDPCFKVPDSQKVDITGAEDLDLNEENKAAEENSESSVASGSSGFGSLPRKQRHTDSDEPSPQPLAVEELQTWSEFEQGHSRNSSSVSQHSRGSGYASQHTTCSSHSTSSSLATSSHGHSRQGSLSASSDHARSPSIGSSQYERSLERRRKLENDSKKKTRVESTRVDTDELIDELINETDFDVSDTAESSGLQLFINKDGSASLGGSNLQHNSSLKQVVFHTS